MYFDLTQMSISALLMIGDDGDLNHKSSNESFVEILERNHDPPGRFVQIDDFDLLQIVEICTAADGDARRGVRFVQLVVRVDGDVANRRFSAELDVHQMGKLAVRLPIRLNRTVS